MKENKLQIKNLKTDLWFCVSALFIHGLITESERDKIAKRYLKLVTPKTIAIKK